MDNYKDDLIFWLAIGNNPKIGSAGFREILATKKDFSEIFSASREKLLMLKLKPKLVEQIIFCQKNINPDKVFEEINMRGIKPIRIIDPEYPEILKQIYDPPAILYVKGEVDLNTTMIGIVGRRRPTDYGLDVTTKIATDLALSGVTIVSGMAYGIDTAAHLAAINAGAKTIAVLGGGMDRISGNTNIAAKIIQNGAIVTEFPIGAPIYKSSFPQRNRIISGLSKALIVTEAAKKSGSLITASCALEQNREVFAVPGSIFNLYSEGPNSLIKMGARVLTDANDVLEELGVVKKGKTKEPPKPANEEEEVIIKLLLEEPAHINEIAKATEIEMAKLSQALTLMEISGKVKQVGGMIYRLNI